MKDLIISTATPLVLKAFKQTKLTDEMTGVIEAIATAVDTAVKSQLSKTQAIGVGVAPGAPLTLSLVSMP